MEAFRRTVLAADTPDGPAWVFVDWDTGRLSVSSVVGPRASGDARGGCGQSMPCAEWKARPGVDLERLAALWKRWHLNDMRPGCEHQRAGQAEELLEVVTYKLTADARKLRRDAEARAVEAAARGEVAELSATERALLACKWYADVPQPPDADSPLSGCYEVAKRETKRAGWVRTDEHPRGMLCRPCPECGYRYGTAWLVEEVPEAVLEELAALPDSEGELTPAWRRR